MAAYGKVRCFNARRGFGYIVPEDGGGDVFVTREALERSGLEALPQGARVAYTLSAAGAERTRSAATIRETDRYFD